ncbi:MAG: LysM peptidoglycan-binding domain-containing protein [Planctomycetota bacterium]
MNRESKLVVIIAFVVCLVVAVLISDHFSTARTQITGAGMTEPEELVVVLPQIPRSGTDPRSAAGGGSSLGTASAADASDRSAAVPPDGAIERRPEAPTSEPEPIEIAIGPRSQPGGLGALLDLAERNGVPLRGVPALEARQEKSESRPAPGPTHTVRSGETMTSIARERLGDARRWRDIEALNPEIDPRALRVGQTLRLPVGAAAVATPAERPAESLAETTMYVVRRGDTLSQISQRLLGTVRRQGEILALNSDKIRDADDLWAGLELRMPAK